MSVVKSRCLAERRSRRWLAGMVVIAGGVIAAAAYTFWPDIQMGVAWRHLRAGRLAEAEAAAQSVLTRHPARADAHLLMARTLRTKRLPQKALSHVWDAARAKPVPDGLRREYALCLAALGQHAQAQPMLQEIFQNGTGDPEVLEALSRYAIQSFHFEQAMEYVDAWNGLAPRDTRVLMLRAEVSKRLFHKHEGTLHAIDDYRRVLTIDPAHYEARLKLGEELFATGRIDEASEEFELCRQQHPQTIEPLYKLALCREREPEEAERLLHQVLDQQPDHANALLALGKIELTLGKPEQAIDRLSRLVERQPYHDKARYGLFLALRNVERDAEAAEHYAEWQRLKAGLSEMATLIEQIQRSPDNMTLRYQAGTLLMEYGLEEEGARWLATILEIDPGHTEARRALSEYQTRLRSGAAATPLPSQKEDHSN
jgi:protein O-GlcNAc transferase